MNISRIVTKSILRFLVSLCLIVSLPSACTPVQDFSTPQESPTVESPLLAEQPTGTQQEQVSPPPQPKAFVSTEASSFRVETVVEGLEVPWAIEALPDGSMLITERPGRLRILRGEQLDPQPIPGLPEIAARGEGGLMDVVLHPDFEQNQWLYLSYTIRGEGGDLRTRVSRFRLTEAGLVEPQVIFAGVPGASGNTHFGSRLAFGLDGKLYITLGERGNPAHAQDLQNLNGKTLRLNDDGTVPEDNPFVGRADALPEIFSFGHRNSQGIAVDPRTGLIFQTEHGPTGYDGPRGGDEVNIVEAGRNYGWPEATYSQSGPGLLPPLVLYQEAIAPAGATFYTGDQFPQWQGDFFFSNLRDQSLIRFVVNGLEIAGQEKLLHRQYGRLRDVAQGTDGYLYITTSDNDGYGAGRQGGDRILRLMPTTTTSFNLCGSDSPSACSVYN
jgi:glucose/arabinose dehydrogenase